MGWFPFLSLKTILYRGEKSELFSKEAISVGSVCEKIFKMSIQQHLMWPMNLKVKQMKL